LSRLPCSRVPSFICRTLAAYSNRDGPVPRSRADHTDWANPSQETAFAVKALNPQAILCTSRAGTRPLCGATPFSLQCCHHEGVACLLNQPPSSDRDPTKTQTQGATATRPTRHRDAAHTHCPLRRGTETSMVKDNVIRWTVIRRTLATSALCAALSMP